MIEEPYRWVEAIANRREYIEHQLAGGSPIAGLNYRDGILLFALGRERQKLFEIYDRIGLGTIGHPGDIERAVEEFGVISGTAASAAKMEQFLRQQTLPAASLEKALDIALDAWTIGHLAQTGEPSDDLPSEQDLAKRRSEQLASSSVEA